MANHQIDTAVARKRLPERREPYWLKVSDRTGLFIGFRKGSDTWVARMRDEEKGPTAQKYKSLGRFGDHRDAVKEAKNWVKGFEAGLTDYKTTVATASDVYLKFLLSEKGREAFLDARGRLQRRVLGRSKAMAVQQRAKPISPHPLATKKLENLKAADLIAWRGVLVSGTLQGEARRKARASSNRDISALLACLNHAYKNQLCSTNRAWVSIRLFSNVAARSGPAYINPEQRRALIAAATGNVADLLKGLCLMGARPRELTRCTVADYDAKAGTLALRSLKGHAERIRQIPLRALDGAESLVKRLCRDKLPGAPIWTRDDGLAWQHSDWDALVRDARDKAGLSNKKFTAYSIRHSFISDAITNKVDALTVAKLCGTSIAMIDRHYGHLLVEAANQGFKKMVLL